MATILLVVHMLIAIFLVIVVLLQRSEGGALGIGGGGGGAGGLMSGRGAANFLTRMTGVLAAAFFATSILLTIIAGRGGEDVIDLGAGSTLPGTGATIPAIDIPPVLPADEPAGDTPTVPFSQ